MLPANINIINVGKNSFSYYLKNNYLLLSFIFFFFENN